MPRTPPITSEDSIKPIFACSLALLRLLPTVAISATDLVRLTPDTWDEYAPAGKEVDCIYGDYVLRNDKIIAVIAEPLPTRNANMTVRNNGAMIIDLTRSDAPNDQLSAYHPNAMEVSFHSPDRVAIKVDGKDASASGGEILRGGKIEWQCSTTAKSGLGVTVRYSLADGADVFDGRPAASESSERVPVEVHAADARRRRPGH
ncbi:MAG: hypothetical protein ABI614_20035 [Planctomycetota bacterium]